MQFLFDFLLRTKIFITLIAFFLSICFCNAQSDIVLTGKVIDSLSNTFLPGAHLFINNRNVGTVSDKSGNYKLLLKPGKIILQVSFLGYVPFEKEFLLKESQNFTIKLNPASISENEVIVRADDRNIFIKSTTPGTFKLKTSELNNIPGFMGSSDPIKALQSSPGIQSVSEGNGGIYVRGGTSGQNLILLDDLTIDNPSHLLGIYSVFNPLNIQNVTLMKGDIPAQYGGKLSSVIEIKTPSSSDKRLNFSGNVGTLSSATFLSGRSKNNKSFFLVSARRTHIDLFKSTFITPLKLDISSFFRSTNYNFKDLYSKYIYKLSDKDRLSAQFFFSSDSYKYKKEPLTNNMTWNNLSNAISWSHQANSRFSYKNVISFSSYSMEMKTIFDKYEFLLGSRFNSLRYKLSFLQLFNKHQLRYGMELVRNNSVPEKIKLTIPDLEKDYMNKLYSLEAYVYVNDVIELSDKLNLSLGLRFSKFSHIGPYDRFEENNSGDLVVVDKYPKNKIIASYNFIEPRISLSYLISENKSVKASYTENSQNFHLAELGSVSVPTDLWVSSTSFIPPEKSKQFSLGYYHSFGDDNFETSSEVYLKETKNQIELKESVTLRTRQSILENDFYVGKGKAQGLEVFIRKKKGNITGWLGYTLSQTKKRFDSINDGRYFNAKYDRRHDLSLVVNYRRSKKWSYSMSFVYASGNNLTLPVGRYIIQDNVVNDYGTINSFRMPSYHRLDVSARYNVLKNKRFESYWVFSLYNVYSRANPYYIYFSAKGELSSYELDVKAKQISLFPILPSVSWNFKF